MKSRRVATVFAVYTNTDAQPVTLVSTEARAREVVANLNKAYPHKRASYVPYGVFD